MTWGFFLAREVWGRSNLDNAHHTSERILRAVSADSAQIASGEVSITLSIGIAVLDPMHDDMHSLLHRADSALCSAKANGPTAWNEIWGLWRRYRPCTERLCTARHPCLTCRVDQPVSGVESSA